MITVDVVCLLYHADDYIENLIKGFKKQEGVIFNNVIFAITECGDTRQVKNKITENGYAFFCVNKEDFSHSLTREKAICDYCTSDKVIMISQDVNLLNSNAFYELVKPLNEEVVFVYGKQICRKKTIEYYVRKKNYGECNRFVSIDDIDKLQLTTFFASDAFSAYHRPTFIKLNGYDNIHMMMSEDMYYAKKIIEAGYKKGYIATAIVEHSHKFTLKQLYNRYCETGKWFSQHPEFNNYKTTDAGLKLAVFVLVHALKDFNLPVIFRWLPDMVARYLGMKKGKKI